MALQSSGAISISQIKTELGSSSNSLRALSAAAGKSTPDAMSEFYGFSGAQPTTYWLSDPNVNPWFVSYSAPEASKSAYVDSIIANSSGPVTERIITLGYNGSNNRYFTLEDPANSGYGYLTNWSRLVPAYTQGATAKVHFRYVADTNSSYTGAELNITIYAPTGYSFANVSASGSGYELISYYPQTTTSTQIRRFVQGNGTAATYTFNLLFDLV